MNKRHIIKALTKALKDSNRHVRFVAARALCSKCSKAAVPALLDALEDADYRVTLAAAIALMRYDADHKAEAMPFFRYAQEQLKRRATIQHLRKPDWLMSIISNVDEQPDLRGRAARELAELPPDKESVAQLMNVLSREGDHEVKIETAKILEAWLKHSPTPNPEAEPDLLDVTMQTCWP